MAKKSSSPISELEIVDRQAYKEWQQICKDPLLNEDRSFVASDGSIIDLLSGFSILYKFKFVIVNTYLFCFYSKWS